jgi:hypothetical protein
LGDTLNEKGGKREIMEMKHYHYGAGLHGCLFQDGPYTAASYKEAIDSLVSLYELDTDREEALRDDSYLELNLERDGNEYMEILPCWETECHPKKGEVSD